MSTANSASIRTTSNRLLLISVLHPDSAQDVVQLVKAAYESNRVLPVSARGHGHSINRQAQTRTGVVIQMSSSKEACELISRRKLPRPRFRARESGQTFNHAQISNVHELDVVTGKGELLTCSEDQNPELFHAVLGGLGQSGIITRARISLEPAPQWVRWIRVLYLDFSAFTGDQEHLISLRAQSGCQKFDYVEGFVIVDEGLVNNWRSSFFSPRNPVQNSSLVATGAEVESVEETKFYLNISVYDLFAVCGFLGPGSQVRVEAPVQGFVGGSTPMAKPFYTQIKDCRIHILGNGRRGPILIYPMNKDKWDQRSSAVMPDERVFYLVALLRSASDNGEETQSLEYLTVQNRQIPRYCEEAGMNVKQYFPHYTTQQVWMDHFGRPRRRLPCYYHHDRLLWPRHLAAVDSRTPDGSPRRSPMVSHHHSYGDSPRQPPLEPVRRAYLLGYKSHRTCKMKEHDSNIATNIGVEEYTNKKRANYSNTDDKKQRKTTERRVKRLTKRCRKPNVVKTVV
ncbi:hypothetical protein F3Y22_tig00002840pilonHSYRG01166 [Hibiscus syriacus]|uniref:Cytokinin dehydrogenase 1 FAD/cytokinin binding domain-containing protein n=1 Tax=Hibiscus syriacus TaxID=106335 RepID=A0A6A3CVC5_HIBSY|nr:hypothetical protein F3Y22_tig00002840pilonHSYRG01166 [Hibiscus syriacus]